MQLFRKSYSEKEIKEILKTMVIVIDTREQKNEHITDYLIKKDVPFHLTKIDTGDYNAMIPKNEEYGITRDIYLSSGVERKAHIDEICGNLQKDKRTAFENELIRSKGKPFTLIVEDKDGYYKMLTGEYRSKYDPLALLGTLNTFKAKYGFEIVYLDKQLTGNWIYHHFLYQARTLLKGGLI